jgi:hypothetical protein
MKDLLKLMFGGNNLMAMVFSLGFLGLGLWMINDQNEEGGGLVLGAGIAGLLFILITSYVKWIKNGK